MTTDEKDVKKRPNKFAQTVLAVLAFFVLVMCVAGQALLQYVFNFIGKSVNGLADNPVWITCTLYITFLGWLLLVLFYMWAVKKNRPIFKAMWNRAKGNNLKWLGIGLLLGFAMNALCILIAYLNGDIRLHFERFDLFPCIILLISVGIQSTTEEVIDRAFFFQRMGRIYKNPWVAIISNAVIFASMHLANNGITIGALANIVLIGILFSMFVYYADSFWAACGIHTAWNFTQNIIFGLPNSGIVTPYSFFKLDAAEARNSFAYNVGFGIEGTWVACIVIVLTGVLFYFLWARKHAVEPVDVWAEENAKTEENGK